MTFQYVCEFILYCYVKANGRLPQQSWMYQVELGEVNIVFYDLLISSACLGTKSSLTVVEIYHLFSRAYKIFTNSYSYFTPLDKHKRSLLISL